MTKISMDSILAEGPLGGLSKRQRKRRRQASRKLELQTSEESQEAETGWWLRMWICIVAGFEWLTRSWRRMWRCLGSEFRWPSGSGMEAEIGRLQEKLASSEDEICQLRHKITLLEIELRKEREARVSETEELKKLRLEVESLRKKLEDADSLSTILKEHLGQAYKRAASLTADKTTLGKEVKNLIYEVETLQGDLSQVRRQYAALEKEHTVTRNNLSEVSESLSKVQKKIVKYDRKDRLSVFRQFALNLEDMIRETVLDLLPEEQKRHFFVYGKRDEEAISNLKYKKFMKDHVSVNTAVLKEYFKGDSGKFSNFVSLVYELKRFSREGAHPTTYGDEAEDVTYEMMRTLIQESDFLDEEKKTTVKGYAKWLKERNPYLQ